MRRSTPREPWLPFADIIPPVIARILRRRTVDPLTGCWLSDYAAASGGYRQILDDDRLELLHRKSFEWHAKRKIPAGLCVLHRCDNPGCFNPAHLFLGDRAANAADMVAKGRSCRGERHYRSKLTASAVREIRISSLSPRELATRYGVSVNSIVNVRWYRTWSHLP